MLQASLAHITFPTIQISPKHHAVTDSKRRRTGIRHDTTKLVAHNKIRQSLLRPALASLPQMHITTANPTSRHTNLHLPRPNNRHRHILHNNRLRTSKHSSLHHFSIHRKSLLYKINRYDETLTLKLTLKSSTAKKK